VNYYLSGMNGYNYKELNNDTDTQNN
jgi:hypothetical protein